MNLGQIRERFAKISGRYDLVDPSDWSDGSYLSADWFINTGIKLLDSLQETKASTARYQTDIASGDYTLEIKLARSIKSVWMVEDDGRYRLVKKDFDWIKSNYTDIDADLDTGEPYYWAPNIIGLSPEQSALTSAAGGTPYTGTFTYDGEDIMFSDEGDWFAYNGIIWMPPADGTYTVIVVADFFSEELTADADTNYWTDQYPMTVVYAACWVLESTLRNREGMADWMGAIMTTITGLDHDLVAQEIAEVGSMKG
jgi:hypothetical protein